MPFTFQAGFLMGASCGGDTPRDALKGIGLVPDHAYSVLDCLQIDADVSGCGALQLLLLRNPHGRTAWSGMSKAATLFSRFAFFSFLWHTEAAR